MLAWRKAGAEGRVVVQSVSCDARGHGGGGTGAAKAGGAIAQSGVVVGIVAIGAGAVGGDDAVGAAAGWCEEVESWPVLGVERALVAVVTGADADDVGQGGGEAGRVGGCAGAGVACGDDVEDAASAASIGGAPGEGVGHGCAGRATAPSVVGYGCSGPADAGGSRPAGGVVDGGGDGEVVGGGRSFKHARGKPAAVVGDAGDTEVVVAPRRDDAGDGDPVGVLRVVDSGIVVAGQSRGKIPPADIVDVAVVIVVAVVSGYLAGVGEGVGREVRVVELQAVIEDGHDDGRGAARLKGPRVDDFGVGTGEGVLAGVAVEVAAKITEVPLPVQEGIVGGVALPALDRVGRSPSVGSGPVKLPGDGDRGVARVFCCEAENVLVGGARYGPVGEEATIANEGQASDGGVLGPRFYDDLVGRDPQITGGRAVDGRDREDPGRGVRGGGVCPAEVPPRGPHPLRVETRSRLGEDHVAPEFAE
jgi:hypothetical protein